MLSAGSGFGALSSVKLLKADVYFIQSVTENEYLIPFFQKNTFSFRSSKASIQILTILSEILYIRQASDPLNSNSMHFICIIRV